MNLLQLQRIRQENVLGFYTILSPINKAPSTEPDIEWPITNPASVSLPSSGTSCGNETVSCAGRSGKTPTLRQLDIAGVPNLWAADGY